MIADISGEVRKNVTGITPEAIGALENYRFPGNVRELKNAIERAVTLTGARTIGLGDLPSEIGGICGSERVESLSLPEEGCALDNVINAVERHFLIKALKRTGGLRKETAKLLGITTRSLRYRLEKHALDVYAKDGEK